jgi:hypothetical protein
LQSFAATRPSPWPSMEKVLSSGRCKEFGRRRLRHLPVAFGVGRSAPCRGHPSTGSCPVCATSLEPEAEGDSPSTHMCSSGADETCYAQPSIRDQPLARPSPFHRMRRTPPVKLPTVGGAAAVRPRIGVVLRVVTSTGCPLNSPSLGQKEFLLS